MLVSAPQVHTAVACLSPRPNTMNEGKKGLHLSLKESRCSSVGCLGLGASQECLLIRLSGSYLLPTVAVQVKWDDTGHFQDTDGYPV